MGLWNNPVVVPHQPSAWEQIQPTILSILGRVALQKMNQNWKAEEAAKEGIRQERLYGMKGLAEGIFQKPGQGSPGQPIDFGGLQLEVAPPSVTAVIGPNGKQLAGQYVYRHGDTRHFFSMPAQWGPPIVAEKNDPHGFAVGDVYGFDPKTNKPTVIKRGPKSLQRIEKEAVAKAKGKAQFPTPSKPLTDPQIRTKLQSLYAFKARLATSKGADETFAWLAREDPDLKAKFEATDVTDIQKWVDNQIGHYTKLLGEKPQKTIKRTGTTEDGRKVVQYTDGTIEYAD